MHLSRTIPYGGEFTLDDIIEKKLIETPEKFFNLTIQLLEGLAHLHQPHRDLYGRVVQFIHRDMKPQNIFIKKNSNGTFDLKIGDLGQLRTVGSKDTQTNRNIQGTKLFMAYEIFIKFVETLETNEIIDPRIYRAVLDRCEHIFSENIFDFYF